jgi:hypothetical protein
MTDCIHQRNPNGGFSGSHRLACCVIDCCTPATAHVSTGHWCGNLCSEHVGRFSSRAGAVVTDQPSIREGEFNAHNNGDN